MAPFDSAAVVAVDAARLGLWWQEEDDVVRVVVPRSTWRLRLISSRLRMAVAAVFIYAAFWTSFVVLSGWLGNSVAASHWWMFAVGASLIAFTWLLFRSPPPVVFVISPKTLHVHEGAGRLSSIELPREHVARIDYVDKSHSVNVVCDDRDVIELHVTDHPEVDRWIAEHLTDVLKCRAKHPPLVSAN